MSASYYMCTLVHASWTLIFKIFRSKSKNGQWTDVKLWERLCSASFEFEKQIICISLTKTVANFLCFSDVALVQLIAAKINIQKRAQNWKINQFNRSLSNIPLWIQQLTLEYYLFYPNSYNLFFLRIASEWALLVCAFNLANQFGPHQ